MKLHHFLTGVVAVGLLLVPMPAHAASAKARPDSATALTNATVVLNVLANDKVGRKPAVKITHRPRSVAASVVAGKVRLSSGKVGVYRISYRVRSSRGTAKSHITFRVRPTPTTAPEVNRLSLYGRLMALPVSGESDGGQSYDRSAYKHWNRGLNATDGCDTRREVLLAEAVVKPMVGSGCALTGGRWYSQYDGVTIEGYSATALDMDHMVPLEEAHSSGAWAWSAAKKEAYANDQGDVRSLIGVTPSSNRSKGARDPGEWMPINASYRCTYLKDWVAVKTRWGLSIDQAEKDAIIYSLTSCGDAKTATIPVTTIAS